MINELKPLSETKWFNKILIAKEICPTAKRVFLFLIIVFPLMNYFCAPWRKDAHGENIPSGSVALISFNMHSAGGAQ
ncbi:MAG: hypothetical protein EHM64_08830 [Ignavibacteriae bacterium]|nr:MAG: hypothetical protein EHM64_08830 [Ignavibacteriota bacterium]